ncbi:hypothetical protein AMTRI_Chr08g209630 [Amborella trichopoda]
MEVFFTLLAMIFVAMAMFFGGNFSQTFRKKKLPPGNLGLPLIGESIGFLKAHKGDKAAAWIEQRIAKFGPVFKTSLMGSKTIVLIGPAANRFMFNDAAIGSHQPVGVTQILGPNNIFELNGERHKIVKSSFMGLLKPDGLRTHVPTMSSIICSQIEREFEGKDSVHAVPIMKRLALRLTCALLFGIADEEWDEDAMVQEFTDAIRAAWTVPIDFPGTTFRRGLKARAKIGEFFSGLLQRRREKMEGGEVGEDVVCSMLGVRDGEGKGLSESEIIDNLVTLMFASHDTTAVVLILTLRQMARDEKVHDKILQEQKKIGREMDGSDGRLTWNELQKMKYTWTVVQELMRMTPPVFGNFKKALKDTTFGGFDIPKGWQVFWVSSGTHLNEKIFQEPQKFEPSRFEASSKSFPSYTYIPFGAGPRSCPGNEFARVEILSTIHHLVTKYRWSEMVPNEPLTHQPLPYPAFGLPIKIETIKNSLQ